MTNNPPVVPQQGPQQDAKGVVLATATGVMLTVERYNDLLDGERGLWATVKAHGKLVAALMKIRDNAGCDQTAIARDALATDLREIDLAAALSASRTTQHDALTEQDWLTLDRIEQTLTTIGAITTDDAKWLIEKLTQLNRCKRETK